MSNEIITPCGIGRLYEADNDKGTVTVEMDFEVLVEFEASQCMRRGKDGTQ